MNRTPAMPAPREVEGGLDSPCVSEDLAVIRDILLERETKRADKAGTPPDFGAALALDNARLVLSLGLRNRPDAWAVTMEELPELWAGVGGRVEA